MWGISLRFLSPIFLSNGDSLIWSQRSHVFSFSLEGIFNPNKVESERKGFEMNSLSIYNWRRLNKDRLASISILREERAPGVGKLDWYGNFEEIIRIFRAIPAGFFERFLKIKIKMFTCLI